MRSLVKIGSFNVLFMNVLCESSSELESELFCDKLETGIDCRSWKSNRSKQRDSKEEIGEVSVDDILARVSHDVGKND